MATAMGLSAEVVSRVEKGFFGRKMLLTSFGGIASMLLFYSCKRLARYQFHFVYSMSHSVW